MRRTRKPTNLYLCGHIKATASKLAEERYGCSLSDLVEQLLKRELKLKRGLLAKKAA